MGFQRSTQAVVWTVHCCIYLVMAFMSGCVSDHNIDLNSHNQYIQEREELALHQLATTYLFPLPESNQDASSEPVVELGEALFSEKNISLDRSISCHSCHPLDNYGVDNEIFSKGVFEQLGRRNTPTVYNAALHLGQFWDGQALTLEEQMDGPIFNSFEMGMLSKNQVINRLKEIPAYHALFAKAYPSDPKPINYPNFVRALSTFEHTLLTPSRFDDYLKGDLMALSVLEKKGLRNMLDFGCIKCHNGQAIGGTSYQKFGLFGYYPDFTGSAGVDYGRYLVTKNDEDKMKFKVPALRNVTKTAPYFHDGSISSLEEAIQIMGMAQLDRLLTNQEILEIISFLEVTASNPYK